MKRKRRKRGRGATRSLTNDCRGSSGGQLCPGEALQGRETERERNQSTWGELSAGETDQGTGERVRADAPHRVGIVSEAEARGEALRGALE